ncbi:helix-turn-helix transcriptional regulator [Kineosporia sp. R_H_3]|uniref:helix-turn-helix domain-containing protein n=1 Tax=Kineosporia sp. R_H_3 TaxID=1961848 RepID=UPI0013046C98|nr:helix-turn-helix transcriptional regulator [Kineosporia sp. R_H_3]
MSTAEFGTQQDAGRRLRADREAAGIDPSTFAELIGRSRSHIRSLENGNRRITEHVAELAAAVLDTDPDRYITPRR